MTSPSLRCLICLVAGFLSLQLGTARAELRVVATVKPIHALVAGVMAGTGKPYLVVKGAASPHTYAMKPSDAAALQNAQLVFRVGGTFDSFLDAAIKNGNASAEVIALGKATGVRTLPYRHGAMWTGAGDHDHAHGSHAGASFDPHIWLDPDNAIKMVGAIAQSLGFTYPDKILQFAQNAAAMAARLQDLQAEIKATVAPVRGRPFLVFHDAYQYFEAAFGVTAAGAVSLGDSRAPGARRINALRQEIVARKVACIFAEPQFQSRIIATLLEGTNVRRGTLDPIGARDPVGADSYFALMRRNANALVDCLGPKE